MKRISFLILALLATLVASGQSVPMHTCIVGGEVRLCSDNPVVSVAPATAATADSSVKFERVNGGWIKTTTTVTPPSASPAPASKPAAPVHRVAPPAPRPAVDAVDYAARGREIARGMVEEMKRQGFKPDTSGANMIAPLRQPAPEPAAPATAPATSGVTQEFANRLVAVERRQSELATAQNQLGGRLATAEERLVVLRDNQNALRDVLANVGAAAVTRSKPNVCTAFLGLQAQGMLKPGAKAPKGCKP